MKNSYLIQQGKFRVDTDRKGIDSIIQFAYMGAAEFEFGALGESLDRMRKCMDEYELIQIFVKEESFKKISIFCKKNETTETLDMIEKIGSGKMYFKCSVDFEYWISPGRFKNYNDFWWDIENDFMFWKFDEEFNHSFQQVIKG